MSSKSSWGITIRTIVFSILLGGASGVLATALTSSYLSSYAVQLGELTTPLRLSEERPKVFPESFEEAVATTKENVLPGLAQFYDSSQNNFAPENVLMQGAVLTSDGWVLTILKDDSEELVNNQIMVGRDIYKIEQVVPDLLLGIVFIKIEAENLPVLAFGNGFDLSAGDQVFVVPSRNAMIATVLMEVDFGKNIIVSSDLPSRRILLQEKLSEINIGAPVSNLAGELVGLVVSISDNDRTEVLPLNSVLPSFQTLLREGDVGGAKLGVNVVDLTNTYGFSESDSRGFEHGALVFGPNAVELDSAAAESGILAGDIILSLNGQPVNNHRTLDELIMEYSTDDTVTVSLDRAGDVIDVQIVLK